MECLEGVVFELERYEDSENSVGEEVGFVEVDVLNEQVVKEKEEVYVLIVVMG